MTCSGCTEMTVVEMMMMVVVAVVAERMLWYMDTVMWDMINYCTGWYC